GLGRTGLGRTANGRFRPVVLKLRCLLPCLLEPLLASCHVEAPAGAETLGELHALEAPAELAFELPSMLGEEEVEISFGPAREARQQVVLGDGGRDRPIDLVVPMSDRLLPR